MVQEKYMDFVCADGLLAERFVTITAGTDSVAYTAAGAQPDGITIGDEDNLKISVQLINNIYMSFALYSEGIIALGADIQVGTDGKAITHSTGIVACVAKTAGVADGTVYGYNKIDTADPTPVGTAGLGVTAAEEINGSYHKTTLTLDGVLSVLPAIAGGASLSVGALIYTLPAGAKIITDAYISVALDEVDGNITADTPDVGLGTVIGVGAVTNLSSPATLENILTGRAAADCNGTATVGTAKTTDAVGGLAIETGAAHTIHFNVADGWAASGETACPIVGTVVIFWKHVA